MKKKIGIAIACALVVAIAVVIIVRTNAPKEIIESGDTTSRYAYSYEKTEKGVIMHIDGAAPEGYQWVAQTEDACVSVEKKSRNPKKADFKVEARNGGTGTVMFSLQNGDDVLVDRIYEIEMQVQVDVAGALTINANDHRELNGLLSCEAGGIRCCAASMSDGTAAICLIDPNDNAWEIKTANSMVRVAVDSEDADNHLIRYQINSKEAGSDVVSLCNAETGEQFDLYVSVDYTGRVDVFDQQFTQENGGNAIAKDYELLIGHTQLPEDAVVSQSGTTELISQKDHETTYAVGCLNFTSGQRNWQLYASDLADEEDLSADYEENATDTNSIYASWQVNGYVYTAEKSSVAVWSDADDISYLLIGNEASEDETVDMAEAIMELMIDG